MCARCALYWCLVSTWLFGLSWPSLADGQVRALPPSMAKTGQPLPYGDVYIPRTGIDELSSLPPVSPRPPWQSGDAYPAVAGPTAQPSTLYVPAPGNLAPPPAAEGVAAIRPIESVARAGHLVDINVQALPPTSGGDCWTWQVLPDGLMYRAYLAGGRESRFASQWVHERDLGWLWDSALGGQVGILRYGSQNDAWPEGWQADIEGAVFPRLDPEHHRDLVSADFRVGVPLTFRRGPWEGKFSYYHLSSHLGDEYIQSHSRPRINYVRDSLVLGLALRPVPDLRLYVETDWAFYFDGGARPWQFQFGIDCSPVRPTGLWPAPFFAVNGRIREEVDFGGSLTVQTGLQWRGQTGHLFRCGMHYFNGKSDQAQFFNDHEEQIGVALWYDH